MYIYLLLALFIIMMILSYFLFKRDIIQPAIIFCTVYVASIISAVYNVNTWNINMQLSTFLVIFLGGMEFVGVSYLVNKYYQKKAETCLDGNKEIEIDMSYQLPVIQGFKIILVCIYEIIMLIWLLRSVFSIASRFGTYSNLSGALTLFKAHTSYNNDASLPGILLFLQKPVIAAAYIFIYVYIKRVIFGEGKVFDKILKNLYYIIPVILFIIQEFLTSNRLSIMALVFAGFTMGVILWNMKNHWNKSINIKVLFIICFISILGLILFYFSASIIGRINSKGLLDYITLYCGGSIECLNQFMQNPPQSSNIMGKETFYYFIKNLYSYGVLKMESFPPIHLEFRYYNGIMIGNVYTAYRRWMYDFGVVGIIILQGIMAFVYNSFYNHIRLMKMKNKRNDFAIIIYGYIIYGVFLHPIDSYLYLQTIRIAFISMFIIFLLGYIFLLRLNFSITNKKINVFYDEKEIIHKGKLKYNNRQ